MCRIYNKTNYMIVDLSRKILRGIALALGGQVDMFEGSVAGDPFWVLRIIGYPVLCHANDREIPKMENDVGWYVVILLFFASLITDFL